MSRWTLRRVLTRWSCKVALPGRHPRRGDVRRPVPLAALGVNVAGSLASNAVLALALAVTVDALRSR